MRCFFLILPVQLPATDAGKRVGLKVFKSGMNKFLKTILYLTACAAVFFFLVNISGAPGGSTEIGSNLQNQNIATIYFLDLNEFGNTSCEANGVVKREVSSKSNIGRRAIEFLLKGLTKEEVNRGLASALNPKTTLNNFEIKNGVAYIDFDSGLNERITERCGAEAVKSQIEKTLKAVAHVNNVVISVDGETKNILAP